MGGLTDYDLIFTSTTRSIRISHIELSHQRSLLSELNGEKLTFSNMTPAEPPSYVPVEFKSANGN
jgi:hypothetical protein